MRVVYSPRYEVSLPGHVWPTAKYRLIADQLGGRHRADRFVQFCEPAAASWQDLGLVHTPEYLSKLRDGTLTEEDVATLELPWQPEFADAFRLMVGGTCAAAAAAIEDGRAAHLGGGLHHAFANHGEGFCPLNDVAVAIRVLQARRIRRAAVVDLDVHHGNGTAMIFERDEGVFTFSIHQQHNYPFFKPRGDLDIGLEDGTRDDQYLAALRGALPHVFASGPELVVYLAGADPYEQDQLGGLKVTRAGLAERDRLVIHAARDAGAPLVVVLAGGYAADIRDTVAIHVATIEMLLASST
ncbi:MAG TPA: histone deacetylase [Vicinamibacterales bacterium]|nr:histone deacetylase [Vicinamibacterales bacterium]